MVRVVLDADGTLAVGRNLPGRGAWLCCDGPDRPSGVCVAEACRRKAFNRALRTVLDEKAYGGLLLQFAAGPPAGRMQAR